MPVLSIITPVKNAELWLSECIQSGLQQDFADWEWIFVDDHSADASLRLISAFAEKDPRIKVYRNSGKGIIPALQKALAEATGTYITRMDADDLMPVGRLHKMLQAIKSAPSKTVVTGLVQYFSDDEVSPGYRSYEQWLNRVAVEKRHWQNLYRECVVASPNWMMRTQDLLEIGGFSGLKYPEDYDLVFRWYEHSFKIKALQENTLNWREHPQRTSRTSKSYSQKAFFKLKLGRFLQLDYQPQKSLCLWGTGHKGRMAAKMLLKSQAPFTWMGLVPGSEPLYEQPMYTYHKLEELAQPQLLIAVYPPQPQKSKLENYLTDLNLVCGRDFWFL